MMRVLKNIPEIVTCTMFAGMVIITCVNVFARYVLDSSMSYAEEIAYFCFTWSVFFGVCVVYKNQGLIAIGVLVDHLPKKLQLIVRTITFLALFIVNVVLVYYSMILATGAWDRVTPALRIPYFYIDISAVFAFTILGFLSLKFAYDTFKGKEIQEKPIEEQS